MCSCKVCGQVKVRQNGGKRGGCSGVYKVDGAGRRWNGLTCPDCRQDQIGVRSNEKQADFGPAHVLYPPKLRACRHCKTMNPNYFECDPCRSTAAKNGSLEEACFADFRGGRKNASRSGWAY